jgi:hypothetical protein
LNNSETAGNYCKLSPNPTSGYLKLEFAAPLQQTIQAKIINSQGIIIKTANIDRNSTFFEFHLDNLTDGLYYLKLGNVQADYKFIKLK